MAERDSGWLSGGVVDAEDARLATGVLAAPGDGPLVNRSGVKPAPGDPGRVQASSTPSKEVTVNPFQAVIQGTRATSAGSYLATLDSVKTIDVLTTSPAHGSNERRDLIVARQFDPQYGDQRTGMVIERVVGTPAAAPVDPAVTGDHLKLARIRVRAGVTVINTSDIIDLRTFTSALGGIAVARTVADRPANPYRGMYVHVQDTNRLCMWDGTRWRAMLAEDDTGWVDLTMAADWEAMGATGAEKGVFQVRRVGVAVHVRGGATRRNSTGPHGSKIGVVPAAFRPPRDHSWVAPTWGGTNAGRPIEVYEISVDVAGDVWLWTAPIGAGETVMLNTSWLQDPAT